MTSTLRGTGLFTSTSTTITIEPCTTGGLRFVTDGVVIEASLKNRTNTPIHPAFAQTSARNTNLAKPGERAPAVLTTEHVLAACAGLGVWHANLILEGPEVPIARVFVSLLEGAHAAPIEPIVITEPIVVERGGARIEARPLAPGVSATFSYELDYGRGAVIEPQRAQWAVGDREAFAQEIAPARTFCLQAEAQAMRAAGMFAAFSPADMLVVGDDGEPIENSWRFDNEPARHKLLDMIGDLALLGRPLCAEVVATRSGHALNHALAAKIAASLVNNQH